jgi:outer membrane receptor protein involved in Fe transport
MNSSGIHREVAWPQVVKVPILNIDDNSISSQSFTNLVLRYGRDVPSGGRWSLAFNVQNLFDDDPPIIPATGGGRFGAQLTSNTYDLFDRRYQLSFNYEL